jgi:hypothetical protein
VLVLQLLTLFVLLLILVQDLLYRAVSWAVFPTLAMLLLVIRYRRGEALHVILQLTAINLLVLMVLFSFVWLYFRLKNGRAGKIIDTKLGWGDIAFFISIAFFFSLTNLVIFIILGLLLVILGWKLWELSIRKKDQYIPLAGLLSAIFAMLVIADWWFGFIDLTSDDLYLKFIGL